MIEFFTLGFPLIDAKTGHLYDTILVWPKTWYVEAHIELQATANGFFSLFHFTTGSDHGINGYRYPGIWLQTSSYILFIADTDGVSNDFQNYYSTNAIPGTTYHIRVEQVFNLTKSKYLVRFYVDRLLIDEKENSQPKEYQNVKVYTCDPWYGSCDGKFVMYGFKYGPLPDASQT